MEKWLWLSLVRLGQGNSGEMVMVTSGKVRAGERWKNSYGYLWQS